MRRPADTKTLCEVFRGAHHIVRALGKHGGLDPRRYPAVAFAVPVVDETFGFPYGALYVLGHFGRSQTGCVPTTSPNDSPEARLLDRLRDPVDRVEVEVDVVAVLGRGDPSADHLDGGKVRRKSPAEKLHRVRIDCKKLRYLLEFFSSLYERRDQSTLVRELKQLQDNLGDFNDICVQQDYLLNISAELPAGQQKVKNTLVAIGSLIETLDRKKQSVKDAFAKTFTNFAAPENQALFRQLFASRKNIEY